MRTDAWLAERLGRPAYTFEEDDGPQELGAGFYQAKVDCGDVARVRALENAGFRVVDVNLTLRREPAPFDAPGAVSVARPAHRAAVMEIAEHGFTTSRFHLDPEIPDAAAAAIKRDWAAALCDSERGETLLVAEAKGAPAGFLGLLEGAVIDLIAVRADARGSGVGRALVAAVSGSALTVGTQAANTGALRFYERLGFETVAARYVLHLHRP